MIKNMKNKGNASILALVTLVVIIVPVIIFGYLRSGQRVGSLAGEVPTFYQASSTVFTLTTSSQRLLATSTGPRRVAATIQPTNCTAGNATYIRLGNDAAATANTGIAITSSSTLAMGDYPSGNPVVLGSVQGITGGGTCTVLVTEWRKQY